jgi:hypothetical protein
LTISAATHARRPRHRASVSGINSYGIAATPTATIASVVFTRVRESSRLAPVVEARATKLSVERNAGLARRRSGRAIL